MVVPPSIHPAPPRRSGVVPITRAVAGHRAAGNGLSAWYFKSVCVLALHAFHEWMHRAYISGFPERRPTFVSINHLEIFLSGDFGFSPVSSRTADQKSIAAERDFLHVAYMAHTTGARRMRFVLRELPMAS